MRHYETKSLYISAALVTVGKKLLTVERRQDSAGRATFVFEDDGTLSELASQYQINQFPTIQPQAFVNSIFYCRNRVAAA